jgi:hypothetical protein
VKKPSIRYPCGHADRAKADQQLKTAYMACEAALAGTEDIDGGPPKSHLVIKKQMAMHVCFFINICTVY